MRRFVLFTGLLLSVAACGAPFPVATPSQDADGKRFAPPAPSRAALYVVAPRDGGVEVSLGQRTLGVLDDRGWLRVDVRPDVYTLRCKSLVIKDAGGFLDLDLRAGQTAFVSVESFALTSPSCRAAIETAATGQAQVRAGPRMKEISGSSD